MSLFAQKSRPEMVATIYGSSQAQLSERLGIVMRCDARFTAGVKIPATARLVSSLLPGCLPCRGYSAPEQKAG